MKKFSEMTVAELLAALASSEPTPGGGTAAAIAGAMGTALLTMVTGLAKSKTNTNEEKAALARARSAIEPITARLAGLADADTQAFNDVMAAYRLPKAADDEKAARSGAIQQALRGATIVPLDTLRAIVEALEHGLVVAEFGNRSAASDVRVAIGLLKAAADGAAANVRINLTSLKDGAFVAATTSETSQLSEEAASHASAALRSLDV